MSRGSPRRDTPSVFSCPTSPASCALLRDEPEASSRKLQRAQQAVHCLGTSPGHVAVPLRRRRLSNADLYSFPHPSSPFLRGGRKWSFALHPVPARWRDKKAFRVPSSAGKVARQYFFASTARQRQHKSAGALFSFAFRQRARGDALLQRSTCTTDQTAMGLSRGETEPHQTAERRVIFSPQ